MGIRLEDLPLRAQQQAVAQLRIEQERRKPKEAGSKRNELPADLAGKCEAKYHNEKTDSLGIRFDSKKEARRYEVLLLRLKAGEIRDLRLQRDFTLQEAYTTTEGKRVRAIRYRADFCYQERKYITRGETQRSGFDTERTSNGVNETSALDGGERYEVWEDAVEDVKSRATRTREYIIKRKLMLEKYNIEIQEV